MNRTAPLSLSTATSAALILAALCVLAIPPALALDGGTLRINTYNGWKAFEVISAGDNPSGDGFAYSVPGTFDGAGAWLVQPSTLRVQFNHETGDASITEVDLDRANLRTAISNVVDTGTTGGVSFVLSARQAYDRWSSDGGLNFTATSSASNTSFGRFCSSQAYAPDTFGPDRGFADSLYITGEEVSNGRIFVIDNVNRDLYQLSGTVGSAPGGIGGMPFDRWENAALIDSGETEHVALLLSPDGGSTRMKIYIGEKGRDASGSASNSLLARNGLAYGSWYYLKGSLPTLGVTNPGTFDTSSLGALASTKLEDVDTSPSEPTRVVLGDQDSGVFTFDFGLTFAGGFNAGASSFTVTKISNQGGGLGILDNPDNVDWTDATTLGGTPYPEGLIFVNEDSSSGEIWSMNPDGSNQVRVGSTTTGAESSGILDVSELVGYAPGSVVITNNQGFPASMTVLIHPDIEASAAAGRVTQLRLGKPSPASVPLEWQPSCSADDDDYAVYVGELGSFTSHTAEVCSTAGMTSTNVPLPTANRYFLVVPVDGSEEGSYGEDSDGVERVVGVVTCASRTLEPACP